MLLGDISLVSAAVGWATGPDIPRKPSVHSARDQPATTGIGAHPCNDAAPTWSDRLFQRHHTAISTRRVAARQMGDVGAAGRGADVVAHRLQTFHKAWSRPEPNMARHVGSYSTFRRTGLGAGGVVDLTNGYRAVKDSIKYGTVVPHNSSVPQPLRMGKPDKHMQSKAVQRAVSKCCVASPELSLPLLSLSLTLEPSHRKYGRRSHRTHAAAALIPSAFACCRPQDRFCTQGLPAKTTRPGYHKCAPVPAALLRDGAERRLLAALGRNRA